MTTIRPLREDEREWANARYAAIRFMATPVHARVWVAELIEPEVPRPDPRVGLGRLIEVEPGAFELGGIWTDETARNRGIARAMVHALLDAARGAWLWCVPFAHLAPFYEEFGFVATSPPWPAAIAAKVAECEAHRLPTVVVQSRPLRGARAR